MIINRANMDDLFKTFMTKFNAAQEQARTRPNPNALMLDDIAMSFTASGSATVHGWLEQIKGMHEWVGDRVLNNIRLGKLTVTNRDFENTVTVKRNDIEDDNYGVAASLIGAMGADSEQLWPKLAVTALTANGNWADGNPFFCSGRKIGDSTVTNAVVTALSAAAVETALAAMQAWTGHGGEPLDVTPECLVVGPAMEATALQIVEALIVANAGGTLAVSNVSPARRLKVRVSNRISGNGWYVTARKGGIPAVAVQQRRLPKLTRMDADTDTNVFMRAEYLYGTDARGEAFCTLPFLAYAGGLSEVAAWSQALADAAAAAG